MLLDRTFFNDLFCPPEVSQALIEHPKTGMLMVWVPSGKFTLHTGRDTPFTVDLPGFHIGVHPVTNQQYAHFVRETKHRSPDICWQDTVKAQHPMTNVSWEDATAYCLWAGLSLPGELEWEKAARWLDGRKYPWGQEWDQNRCRNSNNKGSSTTASVWRYEKGIGPSGAYQMSGNVWEWCADWYDDKSYTRYRQGNLITPSAGSSRVLRGGSWYSDVAACFSAFFRVDGTPSDRFDYAGFRCVRGGDASPHLAGLRSPHPLDY